MFVHVTGAPGSYATAQLALSDHAHVSPRLCYDLDNAIPARRVWNLIGNITSRANYGPQRDHEIETMNPRQLYI